MEFLENKFNGLHKIKENILAIKFIASLEIDIFFYNFVGCCVTYNLY